MTAQSDELRRRAAALLDKATAAETQLTKEDVSRMYRLKDYDGIENARRDGRLNDVLSITVKPETKEN